MGDCKSSILIVDDTDVDRYLLKRYVKKLDEPIHVFEVRDGEEACNFFENFQAMREKFGYKYPPAVIFLDVNMPKKNGLDFLDDFAQLRVDAHAIDSVVIMFSTSKRPEEEARALSHDFVKGYLTKGEINIDSFKSTLSEYIAF